MMGGIFNPAFLSHCQESAQIWPPGPVLEFLPTFEHEYVRSIFCQSIIANIMPFCYPLDPYGALQCQYPWLSSKNAQNCATI